MNGRNHPYLQTTYSRHIVTTRYLPRANPARNPDTLPPVILVATKGRDEAYVATKSIAAAAAQKAKTRKDYVSSFATAVTKLASNSSELLAVVPQILVSEFGATRSELWLWDESSKSAYLTHSSGLAADHRLDYAAANEGPVGKVGAAH